jgi:hypothetical protein
MAHHEPVGVDLPGEVPAPSAEEGDRRNGGENDDTGQHPAQGAARTRLAATVL